MPGGDAYDSFIDFDGFPAASASFASHSPSRSTASSNVRKFGPTSTGTTDAGWVKNNARSNATHGSNHERLAPVVDWPDEESIEPSLLDQKSLQPSRSRDQQIFRRKGAPGSAVTPSYSSSSRSSSIGHGEEQTTNRGRGGVVFESYEATKNASHSRDFGGGGGGHKSSSILSNIAQVARVDPAFANGNAPQSRSMSNRMDIVSGAPQSRNRKDLASPFPVQMRNLNNRKSISRDQNINQNITHNQGTESFGNTSFPVTSVSKRTIPSPPDETISVSVPPPSGTRTTGVVNKLVSMFSNKHQPEPPSKSKPNSTKTSLQPMKQTINAGVQFHITSKQPQKQGTTSSAKATSQPHHNILSNSPPEISPARSNAQSSVTGYSGDSSSYNPTGWPGTVDKRGRTYMMEPSYSESEESSASPQRRSRVGKPTESTLNFRHDDSAQPNAHAATKAECFSFDGGSAMAGAAELEDWLKDDAADDSYLGDRSLGGSERKDDFYGEDQSQNNNSRRSGPIDMDSCLSGSQSAGNNSRKSGPVDLDEAFARRFEGRNVKNDGWREGREASLANISETKTAADRQLEAALGMGNQFRQNPHNSMGSNAGNSRSYSSTSATARLDANAKLQGIDLSGSENRVRASGRSLPNGEKQQGMGYPAGPKIYNEEVDFDYSSPEQYDNSHSSQRRIQPTGLQTLSEEALRLKDRQTAPPREGGTLMLKGYRGFIDKTKDVPNLMDDTSEVSMGTGIYSTGTRSRQHANMGLGLPTTTINSGGRSPSVVSFSNTTSNNGGGRSSSVVSFSNFDSGSDVFDGIQEEPFGSMKKQMLYVSSEDVTKQRRMPANKEITRQSTQPSFANFGDEKLSYSTQFNPFTAGGAPASNTNVRPSQSPHFDQGSGTNNDDFVDSVLDVSALTRGSADASFHHLSGLDKEGEDGFERDLSIYYIQPFMVRKMVRAFRKICTNQMSSSEDTMLYDFESLVDTKKAFALFEMRSRIMETDIDRGLERRGGTNVVDDIVLTPYCQAAARVRDAVIVSKAWRDGATPKDVITAHFLTRRSAKTYFVRRHIQRTRHPGNPFYDHGPQYWLEEAKWLDDTDFMLMRCQSLGAGTMKGFEMFTIGDCQSILLKMTSENCTQLRRELRSAMVRQIEAEELMQEEIDLDGDENIVAEAEQLYRDATVEVKTLSIKLVLADKAFTLVRNRMEQLVETIESLLIEIENGDESEEHTSSSTHSEDEEYDSGSYSEESQESLNRVKLMERAKRAELSAELAVREVLLARQEAEKIKSDKQREIDNLKDKLADMETKSQFLASEHRRLTQDGKSSYLDKLEAKSFLESTYEKDSGEEAARKLRLKQKFRERHAQPEEGNTPDRNKDEEIYQDLDFYSRSLKSVSLNKK